jgi:hypothetical protein
MDGDIATVGSMHFLAWVRLTVNTYQMRSVDLTVDATDALSGLGEIDGECKPHEIRGPSCG